MNKRQTILAVSFATMILGASSQTIFADETQDVAVKEVATVKEVSQTSTNDGLLDTNVQSTADMTATSTSSDSVAEQVPETAQTEVSSASQEVTDSKVEAPEEAASTVTPSADAEIEAVSTTETGAKAVTESTPSAESLDANGLNETANKIATEAGLDISTLTADQKEALNAIILDNQANTGTKLTYKNLEDIVETFLSQDARYAIPYFKADTIKNMPAMTTVDAQTMELTDLDIWDSWPVQDLDTKLVSNWNGYQLVVAMAGAPNKNSNHLYLLYNDYKDNNFANWRNAGPIFGYYANADEQQWSGSATVNSDGTIQLYYTKNDTSYGKLNHQRLATATLNLKVVDGEVVIDSVTNDRELFAGDGYHYQTYQQFESTFNDDINNDGFADRADNYTLRDPHIVKDDDGTRYLVFEANTGLENYQGLHQLYDFKNYGGDTKYNVKNFLSFLNNKEKTKIGAWANGAIGIVRLVGSEKVPIVAEAYTPLVTTHLVTDEVERPSVVKVGNRYYLFTASRISKSSDTEGTIKVRKDVGDDVVMLGFVSDSLRGPYKPLNNSSVVLTASVPADWRTATYSYYAVPVEGSDDTILVTAYMTNRGEIAGVGNNSTWAPSFLVQLSPDGTSHILAAMTEQGDWIWDDSSNTLHHVGTLENSHLPGEDYEVDWERLGSYGGYNLKPHQPLTPHKPVTPNTPVTPVTPVDPQDPTVPTTPTTPEDPAKPEDPMTPVINKEVPVVSAGMALPNTGSKEMNIMSGLMMVLTSMSALLYHRKRKH
ncbi:glycoside hydrolase family 68 protein [Streptococcus sp. zg-JUN1979]|uniref:glycoside hydrolase family 68 protein n=1 Tax=Streptococcus sp. zg-JUN1979 TaxID=3391450 RepID=UPI0039A48E01